MSSRASDINVAGRWALVDVIECTAVTEEIDACVSRAVWDLLEELNTNISEAMNAQLAWELHLDKSVKRGQYVGDR